MALNSFISYSHKDDQFRRELEAHLKILERQGILAAAWSDRIIEAGQRWEESIRANLEAADIILLLISSDFLASDFCYEAELDRAMQRHEKAEARVIPVFLRSCDWKAAKFGALQGVPDNAKPIAQWSDRDEAFTIVASKIREAATSIGATKSVKASGSHKTLVDVNGVMDLIDWDKVRRKVSNWALDHGAKNPYDMGPKNYMKCLHDIGLGGEDNNLEWESDGSLKNQ